MLDYELFDTIRREFDIELDESTKKSLVQYLGRRYKTDSILIEYKELETLTSIALDEPCDTFDYLRPNGTDLTELDSKAFRVINRLERFMTERNITKYTDLFPNRMVKIKGKKEQMNILVNDFYKRLAQIGIRKSDYIIPSLNKFLYKGFEKKFLVLNFLHELIELIRQKNPYILSFGFKRRKLPGYLKSTIYMELELTKEKIEEENEEDSIKSESDLDVSN